MMSVFKHHRLSFEQGPRWGSPVEWEAELGELRGVRRAAVDADRGDIFIEYDLLEIKEEEIERWLVDAGFVLDKGIVERVKRGWIHFTEENELDALRSKPRSCCDVEDGAAKNKKP